MDRDAGHVLSSVTEFDPDQPSNQAYGTMVSTIDNLDFTFSPRTNRFIFDGSFTEVSGKAVDGLWMVLSPGGMPQSNDAAIVYVDLFNRR